MLIDTIFENARARTLDPVRPTARRFGVLHGRIVGLDEELDGAEARRTVDLAGAHVLPGFNDAHLHLSLWGARLAAMDLRPGSVDSLDELYAAVAERARGLGPDEWIRGSGYDQNVLGGHPTAERLDAAAGGRPVLLEHVSAHMVVINTRAFELAGHPGRLDVPDVDGGGIPRDAEGRATGLLQEAAMNLAYNLVRPTPEEEVIRNLGLASERALSYGITSATEPGLGDPFMVGNSPMDFGIFQEAVDRGILRVRMTLMPYFTTLHGIAASGDPAYRGIDLGIRSGMGDERLRIGPVKMLTDGSFIGRSAAMHRCYHGEPDNHGIMVVSPQEAEELAVGAHRAGWQLAFHAIGDAAIDAALDAFEAAQRAYPRPDARPRIEHFALASDAQIARAAALGAIAVPQAIFIRDFGDGMAAAMGDDRRELIYRVRSLLSAGMTVPGSTDAPVSDANPIDAIASMVTRRTSGGEVLNAAEAITVDEAVRAYTHGSAYATRQEEQLGRLRAGMLADFVTLSQDMFAVPSEEIADTRVTATYVGGERVFVRGPGA
ncbi:amidohydrolase [Leucobacter allii]|uniref:Amidohydrolase n=1 Tax=Leucobacter allii TaxID=2932247 RepID=A0ABY4FJF1_9MICO|nr:amidohydrolase [Leucobacter allii]UOQ56814.1 amidohydrolase [Leucobacter allii]